MDDKCCVVPIILTDSVQFHLHYQRVVIIRAGMESFLYLSTLQEVIAWELIVICFRWRTKCFSQNALPIWVIVQQIEVPPRIKLQQSMRITYTLSQIRMPVLKVANKVLQKLEISPYPVIIANDSLKSQRRVSVHTTTRAYADIVFNQNYTIHCSILWDATIVDKLSSIFVLHNLIPI